MRYLFEVIAISFTGGIAARTIFNISSEYVVWLMVLSLALALWWRKRSCQTLCQPVLGLSVIMLALALGIFRTELATWQFGKSNLEESVGSSIELIGVIDEEPDYRANQVQFYVTTSDDRVLVSADRLTDLSYGDRVQITGRLDKPTSFTTDLGRTFDYENYLKARGVEYRLSFAEVSVLDSGGGNWFVGMLLAAKHAFINSVKQTIPEPEVALGNGLLLGVQSSLGDDIEEDFRKTGIIHIVVLSGYNVMLVVAFILFIFSFFLPLRWRFVAGLVAIVSFALIVGLSATVVRASIMASLVLFAQSFGREYNVMRALIFAGLVMIAINPYLLLYDIGFQLSFMATLGLIILSPYFETALLSAKKIKISEFLVATLTTQITVLPLLLYHIGEVSLVAIVVNVLVLPVVPVAMLLTFLTGVVGLISITLAQPIAYLADLSLNYILVVAERFASLPFAAVSVPSFPAYLVPFMYLLMVMLIAYANYRKNGNGWVVEEEKEMAGLPKAPVAPDKPADDIPIFFR